MNQKKKISSALEKNWCKNVKKKLKIGTARLAYKTGSAQIPAPPTVASSSFPVQRNQEQAVLENLKHQPSLNTLCTSNFALLFLFAGLGLGRTCSTLIFIVMIYPFSLRFRKNFFYFRPNKRFSIFICILVCVPILKIYN